VTSRSRLGTSFPADNPRDDRERQEGPNEEQIITLFVNHSIHEFSKLPDEFDRVLHEFDGGRVDAVSEDRKGLLAPLTHLLPLNNVSTIRLRQVRP